MMSFEDSRKGGRTESDVRLLAQQLTSDIRESHNSLDDRTPVSDDLGHLAIQIAKSVVKKRSDPQAETSPGDMSQLSKEIEEQIKLVNATQQLDFRSRNAMQELAFDLASQLENESIKTGARQEQFGLEHTVELDSLEGMIVDDKTLPRGEVPAVVMASSQPQRSPASADEPQELESAAPIDAAGGIPAESDKQLIQLGLDATFETDGLSAPAQKIVEPAPAEAAPLPVVVKAAPQMKPPITTPTRNPNKVYMIISVLLLSLIVALSATAAYLYFR
jgi:hypothetical protein